MMNFACSLFMKLIWNENLPVNAYKVSLNFQKNKDWCSIFGPCIKPLVLLYKNHQTYVGHFRRTFRTRGRQTSILEAVARPKNPQLVDMMWLRMKHDFPDINLNTLLRWANMAKNSLKMVYGYTPNQTVFNTNPVLPYILSAGLPALEGRPFSSVRL